MDVKAYVYIDTGDEILCFKCAVLELIEGERLKNFDLTLEQGSTGDGNDMRGTPSCNRCHKVFQDFCIA